MVTTLLAHGPADCEVPYQGSVELDRALVAFGGPSQARLILEQGYSHYPEFDYNQVETPIANPVEGLQPWRHVRAGHCRPRRPSPDTNVQASKTTTVDPGCTWPGWQRMLTNR